MESDELGTEEGQPLESIQPPPELAEPIAPKKKKQGSGNTRSTKIVARERQQKAVMLRKAGATYEQIADEVGVSRVAAYVMVSKYLKELGEKTKEDGIQVKAMELMRLDEMLLQLWRIISSTEGENRLQAMDRVLKIMDRRAKYENLDSIPEQTINVKSETRKLMAPVLAGATDEELAEFHRVIMGIAQRANNGSAKDDAEGGSGDSPEDDREGAGQSKSA